MSKSAVATFGLPFLVYYNERLGRPCARTFDRW
jgi:hypothetical protein